MAATGLAADTGAPSLVPVPQKMVAHEGAFTLAPDTRIYVNPGARAAGRYLAEQLRKSTGYPLKVSTRYFSSRPVKNAILLTTRKAKKELGAEGYELNVDPDSVVIRGPAAAGVFYGAQTLLQLLPPEALGARTVKDVKWTAPCVAIEDQPRFKWRGFMLDVARHFYTKEEVEQVLDLMSRHKLNTFHWHLADDQGWRIEIKKYPKLTEVGAWRTGIGFNLDPTNTTAYGPDGRYGGFYTPADIRAIVAYAAARHITIVPEIEMPGHSSAALAAYPQFSCSGKSYPTDGRTRGDSGVYCAGKDESFEFLQGVLSEVFRLFPGKEVHIGGDEVNKGNWRLCPLCQARMKQEGLKNEEELQSYFIRRIEKFVNAKDHTMIGWTEIAQGGIAQNAVLMDWKGGGREAASQGHDVVMSPERYCYFDHVQSTNRTAEPRAIGGGVVSLRLMYSFEPVPAGLDAKGEAHILGAQANLWTEYIPNFKHLQYMIFPRMCALAEVDWSPKEARNWEEFSKRLQVHAQRLDQLGLNYRHLTDEPVPPAPRAR